MCSPAVMMRTSEVLEGGVSGWKFTSEDSMRYSIEDKRQLQRDLNLDSLPDDEFMQLVAEANSAAAAPRTAGPPARETTPEALEALVQEATAAELLARAKQASGRSYAELGAGLGVSRQRAAEILGSENLEVRTLVRAAAALGYELRVSLHPVDNSGPALSAVLPSATYAHHE